MAPKTEEQRKQEEAASRRHAKLDNAGVLHMSTNVEQLDKVTIVSNPSLTTTKRAVLTRTLQLPGHEPDYSACTFCLWQEDHTLGNALRWMIMKE